MRPIRQHVQHPRARAGRRARLRLRRRTGGRGRGGRDADVRDDGRDARGRRAGRGGPDVARALERGAPEPPAGHEQGRRGDGRGRGRAGGLLGGDAVDVPARRADVQGLLAWVARVLGPGSPGERARALCCADRAPFACSRRVVDRRLPAL